MISSLVLLFATLLLFVRLGHYAFWDDEALTALAGQGIATTGDTTAFIGHNVVGFRSGTLLRDFKDRFQPPLPNYLVAPFFAAWGRDTFALRFPFALCGLLTVILILRWMKRDAASLLTWLLVSLGLLTNVSFFLFNRQCRYYAVVFLLSAAVAYLYWHWTPTLRHALLMVFTSVLLLFGNHLNWALLWLAIAVDAVVFSRPLLRMKVSLWLLLALPQALAAGYLFVSRYDLIRSHNEKAGLHSLGARLQNVGHLVREMNTDEFGCLPLLVLTVAVCVVARQRSLARGLVAAAVYTLAAGVLAAFAPDVADVRYVSPLIPLLVVIQASGLAFICARSLPLGACLALLVFATNLPHRLIPQGPHARIPARSTFLAYLRELRSPPPEPYTPACDWIARNVPPKATMWVVPYHMVYPLMFHQPHPLYAWQFAADFPGLDRLDPIHQAGRIPPDYVLHFGTDNPAPRALERMAAQGFSYRLVARLDTHGADRFRPELHLRVFDPPRSFDASRDAIFIYRRSPDPASSPATPSVGTTLPSAGPR